MKFLFNKTLYCIKWTCDHRSNCYHFEMPLCEILNKYTEPLENHSIEEIVIMPGFGIKTQN